MNFIQQIERLQQLNKLIEQECTGTPDELAKRLGVSRSKLYEIIDELKTMGKKIKYNRSIQSFHYYDLSRLNINLTIRLIDKTDLKKINGGLKKILPYFFLDGAKLDSLNNLGKDCR